MTTPPTPSSAEAAQPEQPAVVPALSSPVEQTLPRSETHYQRVVEDQTDLICRYRADLTLTYVNAPYAALFGMTPAAMVGRSILAGIPTAYRAQVAAHLAALSPDHPIGSFENPMATADGALRWFHWTDRLLIDAAGKPVAYQGVGRDITSRKLAEDAEREQRRFAEAMRDSLVALTSSLDVEQVMEQILASAATVVPSEAGSIVLAAGAHGRVAYLRGFRAEAAATLRGRRLDLAATPVGDVLTTRVPYSVPDTTCTTHWLNVAENSWIRSSIGVPIEVRGDVVGVLIADSAQPDHFGQRDVEKLQAFAQYAALALENAYHATQLEERVAARTRELQATQATLAEERNLLRTLIDSVPDYIYAKDRQHRFILSNEAHARDRGCQHPDELLGKTDYDLFPTEMAEQFWNEEEQIFATGAPLLDHEQPSVGYGGGFVWALSNKVPLQNLAGEIVGLVGITRDITERKARERQLRYHASLQQTVRDAVIATDLQMCVQSWNPAAEAIYGWRAEEVIGKRVGELLQTRYPVTSTTASNLRALYQQGWWQGEVIQRHRDGADLSFLSSVTLLKDDRGMPFGVVAVNHDITELKAAHEALRQSEEMHRFLIETMRNGFAIYDQADQITYVNDRFCELLGYTRAELIGTSSLTYVDPANAEKITTHLDLRYQGQSSSYELSVLRKDGQSIHLLIAASPLLGEQGQVTGSFAAISDITLQKQAELALRAALDKEKELNELKSRFVSMASHEFRTPLSTIFALTESLVAYRSQMTEAQIDQRLEKVQLQISYLKAIMEDVLHLARLQARRAEFNPAWVNLDALCRSVIDEFLERQDLAPRLHYHCDEPARVVQLDKKLMLQIINNLVSNALKYSADDQPIFIEVRYQASSVLIQVRDEGIGIPAADLPHLFEPFHRATNVGTVAGTGLGLTLVKEAVELHGGEITVESALATGTTFTLTLPAAGAPA